MQGRPPPGQQRRLQDGNVRIGVNSKGCGCDCHARVKIAVCDDGWRRKQHVVLGYKSVSCSWNQWRHLAYGGLQNPVSAQRGGARQIRRPSNICPGRRRHLLNEQAAQFPLRHIAPVQQQVARFAERAANLRQRPAIAMHRRLIKHSSSQQQAACCTVRKDVNSA